MMSGGAAQAKKQKVIFEKPLEDFKFDSARFSTHALDLTKNFDSMDSKELLADENQSRINILKS